MPKAAVVGSERQVRVRRVSCPKRHSYIINIDVKLYEMSLLTSCGKHGHYDPIGLSERGRGRPLSHLSSNSGPSEIAEG